MFDPSLMNPWLFVQFNRDLAQDHKRHGGKVMAHASHILAQLRMAGDKGQPLLNLDRALGQR